MESRLYTLKKRKKESMDKLVPAVVNCHFAAANSILKYDDSVKKERTWFLREAYCKYYDV
jgi:hypothetical protein